MCSQCEALDSALAAAVERRDKANAAAAPSRMTGGHPRMVSAKILAELREANRACTEISEQRTAHIQICARF
jgi:hypothetical protein